LGQDSGFSVSWIVSSFNHYHKKQRSLRDIAQSELQIDLSEGSIRMLETPGYQFNTSPKRLYDHAVFAVKLYKYLRSLDASKVDLVYCSFPTVMSSYAATLFCKKYNVHSIIDIRDKWPDVFIERHTGLKRILAKLLFMFHSYMRDFSFKNANTIIAANESYLQWAKGIVGRGSLEKKNTKVFHIGFKKPNIDSLQIKTRDQSRSKLRVVFGGTLGKMFDFKTIFEAFNKSKDINYQFDIYGDGDGFEEVKRLFINDESVRLHGRVSSLELYKELLQSDVLIAPYIDSSNFFGHLPNKVSEYLSAEKPVISTLRGKCEELLKSYGAGVSYQSSDELSKILREYSTNKSLIISQGKNASRLYSDFFDSDNINEQIKSYLHELKK